MKIIRFFLPSIRTVADYKQCQALKMKQPFIYSIKNQMLKQQSTLIQLVIAQLMESGHP